MKRLENMEKVKKLVFNGYRIYSYEYGDGVIINESRE